MPFGNMHFRPVAKVRGNIRSDVAGTNGRGWYTSRAAAPTTYAMIGSFAVAAAAHGEDRPMKAFHNVVPADHLRNDRNDRLAPLLAHGMTSLFPREVLIVEDEPLVRIDAADAVADSGIMAWEAADAAEAIRVLADHPSIGLIFTDVDMPGEMDGLALARTLSVLRPDVEVIITSGSVAICEDDIPDHGTFLPKPYRTEKLINLVHRKLERLEPVKRQMAVVE